MSDSSLQDAIKEAYASAPSDEVILFTIEMRHPAFTEPLRVVRDSKNLTARLEADAPVNGGEEVLFIAYPFDIKPPDMDEYGKPELTITIDNVGREILVYIEQAVRQRAVIEVTYRLYLASDLSGPQNNPPMTMQAVSISANPTSITLVASFADLSARAFPKFNYTLEQFPSLLTS